ncbi:MAG: DUF952 domain-containing protein [Ahrensia sp.]|nr:DUF952 domain-containing protein [Ahrensia sp.]
MTSKLIYKIATREQWAVAEKTGKFMGAPIDLADGYIHFSTAETARETAAKHFAGQRDLLLIAVDETHLGDALIYEVSRGGALFPHLYAALDLAHVEWVRELPLSETQMHIFPADFDV